MDQNPCVLHVAIGYYKTVYVRHIIIEMITKVSLVHCMLFRYIMFLNIYSCTINGIYNLRILNSKWTPLFQAVTGLKIHNLIRYGDYYITIKKR